MLNHVTVMGRLTKDVELRRTENASVASFTVAVDRDFKNKDGNKDTDFFNCVAWKNTAEFISKYFHKGSMAVVSGRLQTRSWTDKDGNKRSTTEIVADNVYFGDSKNTASDTAPATYAAPTTMTPASDFAMLDDDDAALPF